MARERMKITRPDQTGFGKSVQTGRPKLDAINPEAIKGFKQPAAKAPEPSPPATEPPKADLPPAPETAPVPQHMVDAATGKAPTPAPSSLSVPPETERKKREKPVDSGLAELVLPPRSQAGRNPVQITLRLRALARHVPLLQELESQGFPARRSCAPPSRTCRRCVSSLGMCPRCRKSVLATNGRGGSRRECLLTCCHRSRGRSVMETRHRVPRCCLVRSNLAGSRP